MALIMIISDIVLREIKLYQKYNFIIVSIYVIVTNGLLIKILNISML